MCLTWHHQLFDGTSSLTPSFAFEAHWYCIWFWGVGENASCFLCRHCYSFLKLRYRQAELFCFVSEFKIHNIFVFRRRNVPEATLQSFLQQPATGIFILNSIIPGIFKVGEWVSARSYHTLVYWIRFLPNNFANHLTEDLLHIWPPFVRVIYPPPWDGPTPTLKTPALFHKYVQSKVLFPLRFGLHGSYSRFNVAHGWVFLICVFEAYHALSTSVRCNCQWKWFSEHVYWQ